MKKNLFTIIFVCFCSIFFLFIPNKSNFPTNVYIPVLVSLITKYVLGDWDKNFQWSYLDFFYWISTFGTSFLTILLVKGFIIGPEIKTYHLSLPEIPYFSQSGA